MFVLKRTSLKMNPEVGHVNRVIEVGHVNRVIEVGHVNRVIEVGHVNRAIEVGHANRVIEVGHVNRVILKAEKSVDFMHFLTKSDQYVNRYSPSYNTHQIFF